MLNAASYIGGARIFLGLTLILAGCLKALNLSSFGRSLQQLVPSQAWVASRSTPRAAAGAVVVVEGALGLLLIAGPPALMPVIAVATAAMTVGFVVAVTIAVHKGVTCGCFGELGQTPAGGAEIGRTIALASWAIGLAVLLRHSADRADHLLSPAALLFAGGLAAATVLMTMFGRWARPLPGGPAIIPKSAAAHPIPFTQGLRQALGLVPALAGASTPRPATTSPRSWTAPALSADFADPSVVVGILQAVGQDEPFQAMSRRLDISDIDWATVAAVRGTSGATSFLAVQIPTATADVLLWTVGMAAAPTTIAVRGTERLRTTPGKSLMATPLASDQARHIAALSAVLSAPTDESRSPRAALALAAAAACLACEPAGESGDPSGGNPADPCSICAAADGFTRVDFTR